MKKTAKLILFLSVFLLSFSAKSQSGYFGIGYNLGFGSFDSLNYIVDRYNETRDYLNTEMSAFKSTKGMAYSLGFIGQGFNFEFGLQYNRAKKFAKGVDNTGFEQQRDVQLRMTNLSMDMGVPIFSNSAAIVPGAGFNMAFVRFATRVNPPDEIKDVEYTFTNSELGMQVKFFTKIFLGEMTDTGVKFLVEPYYLLGVYQTDITDLNQLINSYTYQNDPWKISDKMSMFGFRLMMILG